jgi:hypothetical protein
VEVGKELFISNYKIDLQKMNGQSDLFAEYNYA